ncbi:LolA family protein [Virgibacillus salexigens]|uniref:LolA family protein n=1 Tax=Virgibacillus salexigens TaxID=61016 RepID=UPI00190B646B|nr:outer membrane lipoprotein carrier protein LolA [Virgibacillus salexigens]
MKRKIGGWIIVFGFVLLLSACGEKTQEDVVADLKDNMEEMDGYKAKAEMSMNTGQEQQMFNIDVWHKKDDLYRVGLSSNEDEKGNQIILKNEDGVFVLTPALSKSFKFQSEWPENSSQPYLYQSLINDIEKDKEAEFEVTDSHYVFKTKTNYQSNNNLPFQEIYFDKKTLQPVQVNVLDKDRNALVEVKFSNFDQEASFEDDDFSMEKNMASSGSQEEPVSSDKGGNSLTVFYPSYMAGAELTEKKEASTENGERVILTFEGEKNFTLVEEKAEAQKTMASPNEVAGEIVNLGFAVGAISDNSIEWTHDGVDFMLASDELTKEELIQVAQSVQSKEVK